MNKSLANKNNQCIEKLKVKFTDIHKKASDIGQNLLRGHKLTSENIEELGQIIAEKYEYNKHQLIICNLIELSKQLDSHKNNDIDQQPIFILCCNEQNYSITFCIVKQRDVVVCLIQDFSGNAFSKTIKDTVKENFGENIEFKTHEVKNLENENSHLCLKALETMMMYLKPNKKEHFIENFDNPKGTYFESLKQKADNLKSYLFSFIKDNYCRAIYHDIDLLAKDKEFKSKIKEFINKIPLPKDLELFKSYPTLLEKSMEIEENENVDTNEKKRIENQLKTVRCAMTSIAKDAANQFSNIEHGNQQLDIVKDFPKQMEKFTRIFEPLVLAKVDMQFHELLKEICAKLELQYDKLKIFFENKEETITEDEHVMFNIRRTDEIINLLPKPINDLQTPQINTNKSFIQLLSEIILDNLRATKIESLVAGYVNNKIIPQLPDPTVVNSNQSKIKESFELYFSELIVNNLKTSYIDSLIDGYNNIKLFSQSWVKKNALKINDWAVSTKGKLADSEIYEAIAVLDRANELVTGGQRLRDTQILSVLTFLQQKEKGHLTQIQTGEGKTTIIAILAAIKVLKGEKVDVITSNPVLASNGLKNKQLFFDLLTISVATNNLDEKYKSGPRECYKADIVYGTISNFQFDYLKDSFLGLGTRSERPFEWIFLDEVDSMIIDNASHIAKLSELFPGMENLKYIYIKIWQEIHKAEEKIVHEFGKQLKVKAREIQELSLSENESQSIMETFQKELENSIIEKIKDSIVEVNPTKINIIPSHIQDYADNSLDRWINSALDAKFNYHEDEQYVIRTENNEKLIQPVDYANTGITLKNTIWQNGLHQFLQLKHNLHLTSENLTSCFISNLSYINKYGNQIFGLTGTLGSEAEQELLSSIYNVEFSKIPTYTEKRFIEIDSEIVDDELFNAKIADVVISKITSGRAVLIICKTIKDAKTIKKELKKLNITMKTFFDEEHAHITEEEIDSGDVVIATNIAGRGTDFKTSANLESNKGLHVCITFLPCNKRVEGQAFGRTSRQGSHGSAQIIIKRSELEGLDVDSNYFEKVKLIRDQREQERIEFIQKNKIPELKFQDELFELFSKLYRKLQNEFGDKREYKFVLDDLKELWAFWLDKQNFDVLEIANKSVEVKNEFSKFELEASEVIKGTIQFNPYYSIQQAEYFISSNEKFNEAEQSLHHAMHISKNPEILYSVYFKLFEIAIEKGGVFTKKCQEALGKVFLIPNINLDENYKKAAIENLKLATEAIKKEIDYIKELFGDEEFFNILISDDNNETIQSFSDQPKSENLFIKHIVSKQQALILTMNHASSLIKEIEDKNSTGLAIKCRIPDYFCKSEPKNNNESKIIETITNSAWTELAANGMNISYALRDVPNVPEMIVTSARIQIVGGIALVGAGILFPPAAILSEFGATMICEGICDIVLELLNKNSDGKIHKEAFMKKKSDYLCYLDAMHSRNQRVVETSNYFNESQKCLSVDI